MSERALAHSTQTVDDISRSTTTVTLQYDSACNLPTLVERNRAFAPFNCFACYVLGISEETKRIKAKSDSIGASGRGAKSWREELPPPAVGDQAALCFVSRVA